MRISRICCIQITSIFLPSDFVDSLIACACARTPTGYNKCMCMRSEIHKYSNTVIIILRVKVCYAIHDIKTVNTYMEIFQSLGHKIKIQ